MPPLRARMPSKQPWYDPSNMTMRSRPVTVRAMRTAVMMASDPVLQNVTRSTPVSSRNSCAAGPARSDCGPR